MTNPLSWLDDDPNFMAERGMSPAEIYRKTGARQQADGSYKIDKDPQAAIPGLSFLQNDDPLEWLK